MKILFIAKFDAGHNEDETAVSFALRQLGHEVIEVHERNRQEALDIKANVCLFFKWDDTATLSALRMPRVFYYFDLVYHHDPTLHARCASRMAWMARTMPHVALGFCTDGDWVARHPRKLIHLPQGADERMAGRGQANRDIPITFTGISSGGGRERVGFVAEMQARYGSNFLHVTKGVHGRALADLVASSQIMVAPDSPVTNRYCSNRVFLLLGFGGFLIHPWCQFLADYYRDGIEIVYYRNRDELHRLIAHYRNSPTERQAISEAGLQRTIREHLYRHRVSQLISIVQERLNL